MVLLATPPRTEAPTSAAAISFRNLCQFLCEIARDPNVKLLGNMRGEQLLAAFQGRAAKSLDLTTLKQLLRQRC